MVISSQTHKVEYSPLERGRGGLPPQEPHRPVGFDQVSHRVADTYFGFNTLMFAERLGIKTIRPTAGEDEWFIGLEAFPAIVKAAAEHPDRQPNWRTDGEPDRFVAVVRDEQLGGMTDQALARRRREALAGPTQA
jgi:hypothetical protein